MTDFEFQPEDFKSIAGHETVWATIDGKEEGTMIERSVLCANIANARLKEWLDKAPVVYCSDLELDEDLKPELDWTEEQYITNSNWIKEVSRRKARLVHIEKIGKGE